MPEQVRARVTPVSCLILTLVLSVCLGSCDSRHGEGRAFRIDTLSSGTVVVSNTPAEPDSAPAGWAVREVFRLGSPEGDDPTTAFTAIRDLEVDGEGRIYVLDQGAASIPVFGRGGDHVRDIGGPLSGDGPGEFRDPRALLLDRQGRLVVTDLRNRRYTAFDLDGSLIDTYRRVGAGGNPVPGNDGLIWETVTAERDPETAQPSELWFVGKTTEPGSMLTVDTVLRPPPMDRPGWEYQNQGGGVVFTGQIPVPFTPERFDRWDPRGGFWTGTTDALRFVHISPDGDTLRIVERAATPSRVTAEDRDRAVQEIIGQYGQNLAVEVDDVPDVMPLWSGFFLDPEGRLWVERFQPPGAPPLEPRAWEIYDPEGVYLGALDLLMDIEPTPSLGSDRLAGSVTGELGVPYVIVYEMLIGSP